jgi:hypothetical protein
MTQYAVNLMFHSRLASMGYVVVRRRLPRQRRLRREVPQRGCSSSSASRSSKDVHAVLSELSRRGVIDAQRVALLRRLVRRLPDLDGALHRARPMGGGRRAALGHDWRTVPSGYTQPRLGRPSIQKEAYARSSPIDWRRT